ncbi:MAG: LLM class flavin-dependent oxidoreductase [Acidimicrobiia bacterium]|nr:LLM class flavin-dependent oxidoreductase [Acidimicrobiia bacterium]
MARDYGRPLQFGIFPSPDADSVEEIFTMAGIADREGLDLIGIQDHPYQAAYLDTWTLMAAVLTRTERVRVFPDVANLPLRPPAMMAKAAATLDLLSGGRFELGIGAGAFDDAIAAMGGPRRTRAEAAAALEEAIDVLRLFWSGERSVRYEGQHFRLAGAHPGPQPPHRIGIWLGVGGPRLLAALGRGADGWVPSNSYFPPEVLPSMQDRIDEAAAGAGRDPGEIQRIYNVFGLITDGSSDGFLHGPVEQWVDELTELATGDAGMDTFVFGAAEDHVRQTEVFTREVVPAVRDAVGRIRS